MSRSIMISPVFLVGLYNQDQSRLKKTDKKLHDLVKGSPDMLYAGCIVSEAETREIKEYWDAAMRYIGQNLSDSQLLRLVCGLGYDEVVVRFSDENGRKILRRVLNPDSKR